MSNVDYIEDSTNFIKSMEGSNCQMSGIIRIRLIQCYMSLWSLHLNEYYIIIITRKNIIYIMKRNIYKRREVPCTINEANSNFLRCILFLLIYLVYDV